MKTLQAKPYLLICLLIFVIGIIVGFYLKEKDTLSQLKSLIFLKPVIMKGKFIKMANHSQQVMGVIIVVVMMGKLRVL